VVASLGDVAASGGYLIALAADRILAQPGTITGSIGVIAGKLYLSPALKAQGVNPASLSIGRAAGLLSPFEETDRRGERTIDRLVSGTYEGFLVKVAASRRMEPRQARARRSLRRWLTPPAARRAPGTRDRVGGDRAGHWPTHSP
jgi:protease-4